MGRAILGVVGIVIAAATLAFAGCGAEEEATAPKRPTIPAELAAAFASESDQIAATLAAGDGCAAHRQAQALRAHIGDAVGSGQVPPALGREMSAGATSLNDGITCEPAPKPAPEPTLSGCEQVMAQLSELRTQWEEAEAQEHEAHGQEKQEFKDLKEQLEDQAEPLIEQFRDQCGREVHDLKGFEVDGPGSGSFDSAPGNSEHSNGIGHGGGD